MRVAVYSVNAGGGFGNKRAEYIGKAMMRGFERCGVKAEMHREFRGVVADVAIAYGWVHEPVFTAYKAAGGHFVYWDLGYWDRRPHDSPADGYHRLAVDDWDTAKTMIRDCPIDRISRLGLTVQESRAGLGEEVMVAGMSEKAGGTHGFKFGEWEAAMKDRLERICSKYPVVIRPKPGRNSAPQVPIEQALLRTRLLVTHHSNVSIEAVLAGVPTYAIKGVGVLASPKTLTYDGVVDPYVPSYIERAQLLADVAYAQWTPPEMRAGDAWKHIERIIGQ